VLVNPSPVDEPFLVLQAAKKKHVLDSGLGRSDRGCHRSVERVSPQSQCNLGLRLHTYHRNLQDFFHFVSVCAYTSSHRDRLTFFWQRYPILRPHPHLLRRSGHGLEKTQDNIFRMVLRQPVFRILREHGRYHLSPSEHERHGTLKQTVASHSTVFISYYHRYFFKIRGSPSI
jgi:hypothetical protein